MLAQGRGTWYRNQTKPFWFKGTNDEKGILGVKALLVVVTDGAQWIVF